VNAGVILVGAGATFIAHRTIENSGTIEIAGSRGRTGRAAFRFGAPGGYFTGGGEVILEGGRSVLGQQGPTAPTLMINFDNTIMGSGVISSGRASRLINEPAGVIDANGATPLSIHTYIADYGLVEATGAGGLEHRGHFPLHPAARDPVRRRRIVGDAGCAGNQRGRDVRFGGAPASSWRRRAGSTRAGTA